MKAYQINDSEIVIAESMSEACRISAGRNVEVMELMPFKVLMPSSVINNEIDKVINTVCESLSESRLRVLAGTRSNNLVTVRHIICYILNKHFSKTLKECSEAVGRTDHTVASNAIDRIEISIKAKGPILNKLNIALSALGIDADFD